MIESKGSESYPRGWCKTQLGHVLEVVRGASPRPKGDPRYFGGNIPWIMISDVSKQKGKFISVTRDTVTREGAEKSRFLKKGTLILSNSGTVCVPKILAVDGCIHDGFVAFPHLPDGISINFLYHFFNYIRPKIVQENKQGVTQVNLNTTIVSEIELLLPPLPEQHRIVNKIEELFTQLDAGVALLQKTKVLLNQYRQSVLKAAFEGKLTEEWRERNKRKIETADSLINKILDEKGVHAPSPIDTSVLKRLPEGWNWVRISDIASKIQYGYTASSTSEPVGPRFLRITDIQNNHVDWASVPFCKISDEKRPDLLLEEGDIVFARTGATVGKSFLIKGEIPESVFASYLIRIKLSKQFNPNFLYYFFQSNFYWNQIIEKQAGIGQPNVNGTKLSGLILPSPGPEEQTAIVQEIEASFSIADAIESTLLLSADQASALRYSILKTAFQGKLVPQDPNDEPASMLLERIKAERSGEAPRGRKPRQTKMF